jgi:hypothetical protein
MSPLELSLMALAAVCFHLGGLILAGYTYGKLFGNSSMDPLGVDTDD